MTELASSTSATTGPQSGGVPSTYALILFGLVFFPALFIALALAGRRRASSVDWERSHYEMQYRSVAVLLPVGAVLLVLGIALMASFPAGGPTDAHAFRLVASYSGLVAYAAIGWVAVRCVRGLFLAGGKTALRRPRSLAVWPY